MDRLLGMRVFARVVERGSFARAAQDLDLSPTQASAHVAGLERRLDTKLLNRTTRKVSLTADGRAYYERCARILQDIDETESEVSGKHGVLRGTLRVDAPPLFARFVLIPALPKFLAAHPGLSLDLRLRDQLSDLVGEGIDCAIRFAKLAERHKGAAAKYGFLRRELEQRMEAGEASLNEARLDDFRARWDSVDTEAPPIPAKLYRRAVGSGKRTELGSAPSPQQGRD